MISLIRMKRILKTLTIQDLNIRKFYQHKMYLKLTKKIKRSWNLQRMSNNTNKKTQTHQSTVLIKM